MRLRTFPEPELAMLTPEKLKIETVHTIQDGYAVVVGVETPFPKVQAQFTVNLGRHRSISKRCTGKRPSKKFAEK